MAQLSTVYYIYLQTLESVKSLLKTRLFSLASDSCWSVHPWYSMDWIWYTVLTVHFMLRFYTSTAAFLVLLIYCVHFILSLYTYFYFTSFIFTFSVLIYIAQHFGEPQLCFRNLSVCDLRKSSAAPSCSNHNSMTIWPSIFFISSPLFINSQANQGNVSNSYAYWINPLGCNTEKL